MPKGFLAKHNVWAVTSPKENLVSQESNKNRKQIDFKRHGKTIGKSAPHFMYRVGEIVKSCVHQVYIMPVAASVVQISTILLEKNFWNYLNFVNKYLFRASFYIVFVTYIIYTLDDVL
ncbi:Uncharacterized protein M6B38_219790 [Iris pallida]|uniref:Uncharacterized protein n=1 Tax=Iris pallida TaxID=29817 RepID=A0AAX6DY60_IRIPA|nr:Uncharacterized protein M6B38_219790 [Iris pallida]